MPRYQIDKVLKEPKVYYMALFDSEMGYLRREYGVIEQQKAD